MSESVALGDRMSYMQALRATFAIVVVASGSLAENAIGASQSELILVTAAYLLISAGVESFRRLMKIRGLALVDAMLLVDAVYLAVIAYASGGTQSPLRFLVYLHLIATALLTSHRTGLKIAVWHSLLFFVVFYAQASGILESSGDAPSGGTQGDPSVMNVVALLLVAAATSIFASVNERELRRRKTHLEALTETAQELEATSDPREIGRILVRSVSDTFGSKRSVLLAAPDGEALGVLAYRGPGEVPSTPPGMDAAVRSAWESHQPVLAKKLDPDRNPRLAALLPFASNLIVVPLYADHEPIGALVIEHAKSGKVERHVLEMIGQFTAHASLALRNAWLIQQIQRMADTDGLTGVANRRTFERVLEREISRAGRNGEQVSLVMLDIDHFKNLNDTHGHQTGDDVLKGVAAALRRSSRDFDTPARYGGEEFAVVLPGCTLQESLIAAERLRSSIGDADLPVAVTASAGVATFPNHAGDQASLLKAADEALYESKRAGRNRVTRSRRQAPVREKLPPPDPSLVDLPSKDVGG